MKDRINQFIASESLNAAEFADRIGVQRSSVSHVLNGRNNPGFSFIQKILDTFPNLNSRWLLTGNGNMYENSGVAQSKPNKAPQLFQAPFQEPQDSNRERINEVEPYQKKLQKVDQSIKEEGHVLSASDQSKKVTRVLIFYDDHTFEDFRPAK